MRGVEAERGKEDKVRKQFLCSTFLDALSKVAADFVNSAGAHTNIHILNQSAEILMCKASLGLFFFCFF